MQCKRCESGDGVAVCLFCGHPFCGLHRGESSGAPACTACLEGERARKLRVEARARARAQAAAAPARPARSGGTLKVEVSPAPPRPLPEPRGWQPVLWGLGAAAGAGLYAFWFLGWLGERQELASWIPPTGAGLGAAVAFCGVWAIVKSR